MASSKAMEIARLEMRLSALEESNKKTQEVYEAKLKENESKKQRYIAMMRDNIITKTNTGVMRGCAFMYKDNGNHMKLLDKAQEFLDQLRKEIKEVDLVQNRQRLIKYIDKLQAIEKEICEELVVSEYVKFGDLFKQACAEAKSLD